MAAVAMLKIENLRAIQQLLDRMPYWARRELADAIAEYASDVTSASRRRATSRLARLAARSLSDQASGEGATITGGGNTRIPNGNGTYGDVFFGAEFGGGSRPRTRQFEPYRSRGYWFWPSLWEAKQQDRMNDVLEELAKIWEG